MSDLKDIVSLPAVAQGSIYNSLQSFADGQRIAQALAASTLVPKDYQGNVANTLVALEMAQRTGSSPMAVMQNMHVIHGRPSWSAQFVIAALNSCGRFGPLRFKVTGSGDNESCVAWAIDRASGDEIEGPAVSIGMAKAEGWFLKSGSKWQTMPQLMLRYRAAKFFGNLYAPDVLMGMHTTEEIEDIGPVRDVTPSRPASFASIVEPEEFAEDATEIVETEPEPAPEPEPPKRRTRTVAAPAIEPEPEPTLERAPEPAPAPAKKQAAAPKSTQPASAGTDVF